VVWATLNRNSEDATVLRTLRDRRVLITGASSGIGKALAEEAARQGARVILTARSTERLDLLAGEINHDGGRAIAVAGDITSDTDRRRLVQTAVDQCGGLDVLINNAGIASFGHFADSSEAVLRQIMEVNFFAAAELIRLAIPHLCKGQQPAVVNIASMCGRRGLPAWPEYSASKFALCGLTEALRGEMARFDIDVLLVLPGMTNTGLGEHLLRNEGKMKIDFRTGMEPKAVAQAVLTGLAKNRAEIVLGREARWMLRVNRFFPRLVDRLLARKVVQLYAHS
jgi:short-subunit dehydrogenase